MLLKVNVLPTDKIYYMTSENICSRCRRKLREDEVPLMFWPEPPEGERYTDHGRDWLLIYCNDCIEGVLQPVNDDKEGK